VVPVYSCDALHAFCLLHAADAYAHTGPLATPSPPLVWFVAVVRRDGRGLLALFFTRLALTTLPARLPADRRMNLIILCLQSSLLLPP